MKPSDRISIAKDFSTEPIGRYRTDSPVSGEVFRDDFLLPALKMHRVIEIDLDGTEGYGSSFLEEAFGGLVRVNGLDSEELPSRLRFVSSEEPVLVDEILSYIEDAGKKQVNPRSKH